MFVCVCFFLCQQKFPSNHFISFTYNFVYLRYSKIKMTFRYGPAIWILLYKFISNLFKYYSYLHFCVFFFIFLTEIFFSKLSRPTFENFEIFILLWLCMPIDFRKYLYSTSYFLWETHKKYDWQSGYYDCSFFFC